MSDRGCAGHPELSAELRGLAVAVLDRIEPVVDRLRAEPPVPAPSPAPTPSPCALCPVCALIATLRGERPEMAVRFAEHAGGLVTVLRAALAEPEREPPPAQTRLVQRITVTRPSGGAPPC